MYDVQTEIGKQIFIYLQTFCIGSGAQYVLSRKELSSFLTVNFAGGMGLTLGIYFSGGVSGRSASSYIKYNQGIREIVMFFIHHKKEIFKTLKML